MYIALLEYTKLQLSCVDNCYCYPVTVPAQYACLQHVSSCSYVMYAEAQQFDQHHHGISTLVLFIVYLD